MTDLTHEQMTQAADEVFKEIAPILEQFPMGVALELGAGILRAVMEILRDNGEYDNALYVVTALQSELDNARQAIVNAKEEAQRQPADAPA